MEQRGQLLEGGADITAATFHHGNQSACRALNNTSSHPGHWYLHPESDLACPPCLCTATFYEL